MTYADYIHTDRQLRQDLPPTALCELTWRKRRRQIEEYLVGLRKTGECLRIPIDPLAGWRPLAAYRFCLMRLQDGDLSPTTTDLGLWLFSLYVESDCLWALSLAELNDSTCQAVTATGPVLATVLRVPPAAALVGMRFSRRISQQFDRIVANAVKFHGQFTVMNQSRLEAVEASH